MRKIGSLLVVLWITICLLLCTSCIVYHMLKNSKTLFHIASMMDYYEKAHPVLVQNLKNQIADEDLQSVVSEVVTIDRLTEDIQSMIKGQTSKIEENIEKTFKEAFLKKLDEKEYDDNALDCLTHSLASSYSKNLFPYPEVTKLRSLLPQIHHLKFVFLFCILLTIGSYLIPFLIFEKPISIFSRAQFLTSFILLFPYAFCKIGKLFYHFYYTNSYFSSYIQNSIYYMVEVLGLFGFSLFIATLLLELFQKNGK